jgi:hypothetical protein
MTIHLLAVLVLGLMCGSELNVAAFAHPTLNGQPLEVHIPVRSSFAALFGHVMPFWMAGSALLNLLLLLPFEHLSKVRMAPRRNRSRDPGFRRCVFARRSGAHQQPDCEMDTSIASERLAGPRASLGFVPLVQNLWIDCSVRGSCPQRWRPLRE